MSRTSKTNIWIMRLAAILLCLTLITLWMVCQMYARYTASGEGSDNARVAKFSVSESDSMQSCTYAVEIDPDTTESLEVQITNHSETSVKYTIAFLTEGNLPLTITPDTSSGEGNTLSKEETNIWTTTKNANLNTTEKYKFNLKLSESGYMYSGGTGIITITFTAEQVD